MYQLTQVKVIREQREILSIDSLTIDPHALTVVLGHNGSGKSTLVNLLANQFEPEKGGVTLAEKPLTQYSAKELARTVAYLPQKLPEVAGLTVKELVRLGRFPWRGTLGRWRTEDEQIIAQAMQATGVTAFKDTLADQLSGGERQRTWVAMLLAQQADLLILDEPTSALDIQHQYQLMQLLSDLNKTTGKGVIVILHDLNLALRFATQIVALKAGRIDFSGGAELLLDEQRLSDLYTTPVSLIDHPSQPHKVAVIC
ncbi:ABC transporter ATP-binding protein [Shewanella fidelis]|uniref:ABC transporter ATP-binding protein n=1 Tax=Shewanella fidelis TaxID=173509 RepID=A0AAW8NSI1_9GAMM|nr:ABC transporter ATP-binding protein [Shewanella fidelis]MDR8526109.1 ABC transporter ATP-binding protein [Shewanella fidelis]MDW4813722.1 ABC transporter ATP-binding protein [Shewanella fidelis]MDW4817818.1 ABC transporter ATP-binding protein [Shewanella fidelis]MDW4821921.1 ABC transporter ATP-binding protein [Shewanella fidelis]MDW4826050.1 ABC transporter ATP-binding protein [Shewanella fidelis]